MSSQAYVIMDQPNGLPIVIGCVPNDPGHLAEVIFQNVKANFNYLLKKKRIHDVYLTSIDDADDFDGCFEVSNFLANGEQIIHDYLANTMKHDLFDFVVENDATELIYRYIIQYAD